ncbi:MAG: proline dehydrogenase family protein [Fidelibacterota bacterium]|jgi:proline dehydrogenase|tara:strand:- start:601 stop:1500 length:900 start_codon:yes stop_codon:yes gene_type:complete
MAITNSLLATIMPYLPKELVRPFAKPYVAGESIDSVIKTAKKLNDNGFSTTLDILGEFVNSKDEANKIKDSYSELIKKIALEKLDSTISVKLTHLGLGIDPNLGEKNIHSLSLIGKENNVGITIDMENSHYTSKTFEIYKNAVLNNEELGTVIQAYLYRSIDDIKDLDSTLLNLRICKGIYNESQDIAIKDRFAINDNYFEMAKILLKGQGYACLATHDLTLIDRLESFIEKNSISPHRFEFQMLYGVPMGNKLEKLKRKGYKVRIYVPFGKSWFEYSVRRLKENPKIISYVLKNLFKK